MGKVEVNWQLAPAPAEREDRPDLAQRPGRKGGAGAWRGRLAIALLVLGLLALGAWALTRIGWQRIQLQLEHEVAYEDTQSRAGLIDVVLAVQARDAEAWRRLRAVEVVAHLPAPLPAANLVPVDQPARIVELKLAGANIYAARVRRAYADAAGQTYEFDVWQRYRGLGAGLWERLPPDEAGLASVKAWAGRRLSADFPVADAPILVPMLAQIDADLELGCQDWACPPELIAPFTFTGQLAALPVVTPTVRPADHRLGPYPATFDWALNGDHTAEAILLPAPSLAGLPADDAARQALARSLAARGLLFIVETQAGPRARATNYFREALVAEAEIRLGLAPAPHDAPRPETYRRPEQLWALPRGAPNRLPELELAYRLQVLSFLDFSLAARPATVYRQLFGALRYGLHPRDWLAVAVGLDLQHRLDDWAQAAARRFEQNAVTDWRRFDGLAFACRDEIDLVRDGQPEIVLPDSEGLALEPAGLAPDGQSVVLRDWINDRRTDLALLDLRTAHTLTVGTSPVIDVFGWSAEGDLLYVQQAPGAAGLSAELELWRYTPDSGHNERLIAETVSGLYGGSQRWAPDRQALGLTLLYANADETWRQAPAVLSLASPARATPLAPEGRDPTFSPDGRYIAYVLQRAQPQSPFDPASAIVLHDRRDGSQTELVALAGLALAPPTYLQALLWSPSSNRLALAATSADGPNRLYLVDRQTRRAELLADLPPGNMAYPEGFSADGRYLAYVEFAAGGDELRLTVLDLTQGRRQQYLGYSMAWSPSGHQLALVNPAGVYVVDPQTGAYDWITSGNCSQVVWYVLPPSAAR